MTDTLPRIPSKRGTVVAGAIGNVLEWYDFAIYGFFAATIGCQFLPGSSEVDSLIAAFGVFAADYLMRPIGGLVFGYIGDTHGRKATLVLSTADGNPDLHDRAAADGGPDRNIGPGLLVAFRLLQGLSIGGERTGDA
jgi:MHS family proline/betaine transporter-like MFS transporter